MTNDLKPCPFCGGKASLFVEDGVRVICNVCYASSKILVDSLSAKGVVGNAVMSVVNAWNRRASDENRAE